MHANCTAGLESADPSRSVDDPWNDGQIDWIHAQALEEAEVRIIVEAWSWDEETTRVREI